MDVEQTADANGSAASVAPSRPIGYTSVSSTDTAELTHDVREWNFEFLQLSPGKFSAHGAMLNLDGVSIARVSMGQTLLQRGFAQRGTLAVFIPGVGSGPAYVQGQLLEPGQCATLTEGAQLESITREGYCDVCFGLDLIVCRPQLEALNGGSIGLAPGACIAAPGTSWTTDILDRVDWLLATVTEYPQCLGDERVERVSPTMHWPRWCGSTVLPLMSMQQPEAHAQADEPPCGSRATSSTQGWRAAATVRIVQPGESADPVSRIWFSGDHGPDPSRVHSIAAVECRPTSAATANVGTAALDLGDRHGRRLLAPQPVCSGLSPVLWRDTDRNKTPCEEQLGGDVHAAELGLANAAGN